MRPNDTLVITRLDRLGRSLRETVWFIPGQESAFLWSRNRQESARCCCVSFVTIYRPKNKTPVTM